MVVVVIMPILKIVDIIATDTHDIKSPVEIIDNSTGDFCFHIDFGIIYIILKETFS